MKGHDFMFSSFVKVTFNIDRKLVEFGLYAPQSVTILGPRKLNPEVIEWSEY